LTSQTIRKIIISRTDAIGDVVLTLPLAALLKKILGTDVKIIFFGRKYTQPVIQCCEAVDEFLDYDIFQSCSEEEKTKYIKNCGADVILHIFPRKKIASAARKAGIPLRIGTTNRLYHWWTCNKLVRLSRKNSPLHESELNTLLLKGLGHKDKHLLSELSALYSLTRIPALDKNISLQLAPNLFKLVIHPKSNASAREWSLENYSSLIRRLDKNHFQVIITGGPDEKILLDEWIKTLPAGILNLAGSLSLDQLIALLNSVDGIVAASTGPLHLAAALGKYALGIYPPIRPMDPGRWAPVGKHAAFLVMQKQCSDCRNSPSACHCMNEITPNDVEAVILKWL
jgi:ADP-heptose:LPS heptosyltransferase